MHSPITTLRDLTSLALEATAATLEWWQEALYALAAKVDPPDKTGPLGLVQTGPVTTSTIQADLDAHTRLLEEHLDDRDAYGTGVMEEQWSGLTLSDPGITCPLCHACPVAASLDVPNALAPHRYGDTAPGVPEDTCNGLSAWAAGRGW